VTHGPLTRDSELVRATQKIATEVAEVHAADVDAKPRFPKETFDALRREKLLSAAVPKSHGGHGASMRELSAMCTALAQGCGASGMVLAMHHIQVASIARHVGGSAFFDAYLRELVERQRLVASVTSEVGTWGDTRTSICAPEISGGRFKLVKDATTVSYAEHADDLLITCRRSADAPQNDQILVLAKQGEFSLEKTGTWDTMGMRGTCSPGFKVSSTGPEEQIVPGSFADSSAQSMVPYSHILWSSVWLGIASDALARAASFVRAAARKNPGTLPPSATRLAEATVLLERMKAQVASAAAEFDHVDAMPDGREQLGTIGYALKMNHLKVATSEAAPEIVHRALHIAGVVGYKNDSKFSVSRQYRDVLSAALMIGNDRILSKSASMLLVFKDA
jgi:acyl-CoA dehydrogenase